MKVLDTGIIYRNPIPHIYSRHGYFPSAVKLPSGRMVATFSIGEAFESADLHAYASVSDDNGKTWSEPRELWGKVPSFCDFCRISLLDSGEITAIVSRCDRSRPDSGLANPDTMGFTETEFWTQRSTDGENWSEPQKIEAPLVGPSFELCAPIRQLSDGRLILPTSTWKGWDGYCPNGMKAVALVSSNNGKTWDEYMDVMADTEDNIIYWESRICELKDKSLLATAWTYDSKADSDLSVSYAISDGKLFSAPASTELQGQTTDIITLPDGRILTIYRRTDKPGLWGNVSRIENDKWINEEELHLWGNTVSAKVGDDENMVANFNNLRFGAPNTIFIDEKTIFISFWCIEDNVGNIRYIKLEI